MKPWPPTRRIRRRLLWLAGSLGMLALVWGLCPRPSLYPEGLAFSQSLEDRDGKLVHLALTPDGKYRLRTSLADISGNMVNATLAMEDKHFREHPGVNPLSMLRAVWGVVTGARHGGGSTITMQYARLRWQLKTTSIFGKAGQMLRALQLERHYTKDAILEAYFNLAPYGGNVEGAGTASVLWYGKAAKDLNLRESVSLAVLPQSPTRRRPATGKVNAAHTTAAQRLWERLKTRNDPLDGSFALRPEAVVPRELPHVARRLFQQNPRAPRVRSTIDMTCQRALEHALTEYIGQRREVGIANGCALLVHVPTREILGYAGSAEFLNDKILGQVDGITARRSPGSALKPFIYALAMQQGLIHPRSLVKDGRLNYSDYNPENFDREFIGPIPAQEALFRSRNIPAIALAEKLAEPGLYGFLQTAGVKLPKPEAFYGLSLPLGGAEVSPEELASLYAMLAGDGLPLPLRLQATAAPSRRTATPLLTPESRWLTTEMLRGPAKSEIAWKTGTSHGFRDAWCAGIRGDYVLVVWLGNFDGKGNPALVARRSAAPLLTKMFERLTLPIRHQAPPVGVKQVELCSVSGSLPTTACQHRTHGWFMPGISPIKACELHQEILVEAASGLRVARDDGTRPLRREVWECWAPDMMELFKQAGLPRRPLPAWAPGEAPSEFAGAREGPKIVSPVVHRTYTLRAHDPARQSIPLRAQTAAEVRQVFWFAGDRYLGASAPVDSLLWHAAPGTWKLQVLDDHGRSSTCDVLVELAE